MPQSVQAEYAAGLREMLLAPAGPATTDFLRLVTQRTSTMVPTLLCEEAIGTMKNTRGTKNARKFRRPAKSMAAALAHGVVDVRHKFTSAQMDRPLGHRV